ncbi:MAG: M48 family metallopeptidase [Candidatus Brennerbacteria bacterium]|nr:M48 family metallopeptidase [Candidatus Brennerbacteria bacterium]
MSLYAHRDSNIRKTWILFSVFLIVVIGLGFVFSEFYNSPDILFFAVIFSVGMSFFSYWYSDKIVLKMAGAVPVEKKDAPELYNVVENLAITAGLPVPKIYLISERSPNAFATGRDPKHAVVAVTKGLLDILDRSELEGVIAHELSHIGNRDMLISTAVVVLVGFVSLASNFLTRSFFWSPTLHSYGDGAGGFGGRRDDRRGSSPIFLLIGLALAILAPLSATLIQLAISRKREFLADASGALLTRYQECLARALEKISKNSIPLTSANTATAHLYIADPFSARGGSAFGGKGKDAAGFLKNLFMTHPPIVKRVQALRGMDI